MRPSKLTSELSEKFLLLIRQGHTLSVACAACGVTPRTVYSWKRKGRTNGDENEPYQVFLQSFLKAQGVGIIALERAVLEGARIDPDLALKVLERRCWQDWSRHRWELRLLRKELAELRELVRARWPA